MSWMDTGPFNWDPFAEMRQLQADMNRAFNDAGAPDRAGAYPPVNVWAGQNSVAVATELPGLTREDIELTIQEDTLTVEGERKPPTGEGMAWHRRERGYGRFSRTIKLPFRIDPEQVQARFVNGLLEVEMQRPKADLPRKIEIGAK